jgi:hypothetical protein
MSIFLQLVHLKASSSVVEDFQPPGAGFLLAEDRSGFRGRKRGHVIGVQDDSQHRNLIGRLFEKRRDIGWFPAHFPSLNADTRG